MDANESRHTREKEIERPKPCLSEMTTIDNNSRGNVAGTNVKETETDVDVVVHESKSLKLDQLPIEPPNGNTTVRARIRLPNGARCTRLFANKDKLSDIKCWINHELVNNGLAHVVSRFRLISTHPRTIYDENDQTLEQLGFWRPNAIRQLETPMLYVEECME